MIILRATRPYTCQCVLIIAKICRCCCHGSRRTRRCWVWRKQVEFRHRQGSSTFVAESTLLNMRPAMAMAMVSSVSSESRPPQCPDRNHPGKQKIHLPQVVMFHSLWCWYYYGLRLLPNPKTDSNLVARKLAASTTFLFRLTTALIFLFTPVSPGDLARCLQGTADCAWLGWPRHSFCTNQKHRNSFV